MREAITAAALILTLSCSARAGDMSTGAAPPPTMAAGGHIEMPLTAESPAAGGEIETTYGEIHNPLLPLILSLLRAALP